MQESEYMTLALDTAKELEKGPHVMQAGPFRGKLGDALKWLRSQGINWPAILAKLPQIIAAFAAGDWASVIAALISLFGLPANTTVPPQPA